MTALTSYVRSATLTGLTPYQGPFDAPQAAHLLRRSVIGPTPAEITQAVNAGLSGTLANLFAPVAAPTPPVNHFFNGDPYVPVGTPWVNQPKAAGVDVGHYRYPSLTGWYLQQLFDAPCHIRERLTMFWINHFGMADQGVHRAQYDVIKLFNEHGAGNFQRLVERVTVHPLMLSFLNGNYSSKEQPNENYARELLELFTIHKGPQVGPGDYTNYTEQDVATIARCLTGWRNRGMEHEPDQAVESFFDPEWHDDETDPTNPNQAPKQLSHRFGRAVITNNDADEYKDVIAIIFAQPETARAISRALYRYFVYHEIGQAVEQNVIQPMAAYLLANDYNIGGVLQLLLSSEHFFSLAVRGPIIKNPYEYIVSMLRPLGGFGHLGLSLVHNGQNTNQLATIYGVGTAFHWEAFLMGMDILTPPTVAGWKAYYQAPRYYRDWISTTTLQRRHKLAENITGQGLSTPDQNQNHVPRPMDWLGFINGLTNPYDVYAVVNQITETFLPRPLASEQLTALRALLTGGVSDNEWTVQYGAYAASPMDPATSGPLRQRVQTFFRRLFTMAEFHLQ